jgi:hypothetical protein
MKLVTNARVSGDLLRDELQRVLSLYFGAPRHIRGLRRRRSTYSSSYTIENLEVELGHGRHLSLVFKDLSPTSLLEEAQHVRPQFLYRPQREIEIYQTILNSESFGTPICYGAVQRPELERYWLFLERVDGPLLWQVGRLEIWERTARWAARLHSHFAIDNRHRNSAMLAPLLRYDSDHCGRWIIRAVDFLSRGRNSISHGVHDQFMRLAGNYEQVVGRLLALPQTFIHGEFYPSNVILRGKGSAKQVCPIDWEVAAIGPGLIDLAALASGTWTPDQQKTLVAAYRDAVEPDRDWPPPMNQLLELVDYCQLHLAVQWLGWSSDWSPPKSHTRDWLGEALRLANRLGLSSQCAKRFRYRC